MVSIFTSESEDEEGAWDTPSDKFLAATVFLLIGVVAGGWYTLNQPSINNKIYDLTHEPPNYTGGELVFTEEHRAMMNKVYREVSDEYGWCLRADQGMVEEVSHFASLNYTTEQNISFSCYTDRYNGIMHTHPGGAAMLSDLDAETLKENEWNEVSCIVANPVSDYRDRNPRGFACFTVDDGKILRVDTVFQ